MRHLWLIALLLSIGTSYAQDAEIRAHPCGTYDTTVKFLKDEHKEVPVGTGQSDLGTFIQLFASPDGETFSIIFVYPNGRACLLSIGKYWEQIDILKGDPM